MPIAVADLLDPRRIQLELRASDQISAVRELIESMVDSGAIKNASVFLDIVLKRERTNSTLAENGVAFPHARTDTVDEIVLATGRSERGIPWPEESGRAHLIFLIGVPQNLISDYLVVIGMIARTTRDDALRTLLLHAENRDEFIATMLSAPSI